MDKTENVGSGAGAETREIGVDGMTCDNCARRVEKALRGVGGVRDVRVDRSAAVAVVTFDSSVTGVPALQDAVRKSGYEPR